MQKALRLLCALVAGSPAHGRACQELRAVRLLVSLLLACEQHLQHLCRTTPPETSGVLRCSTTPSHHFASKDTGDGSAGCSGSTGQFLDAAKLDQVAQTMQQALWALSAVVDSCPAAERDFVDCGGISEISKYAALLVSCLLYTNNKFERSHHWLCTRVT
jgi:hypothetical protein